MSALSVVIITFNEEKNIARCLDSVQDIADEVIVADSFSTDKTREICSRYPNLVFFQHEFDNYGNQKNRADARAKHDFILTLDADEALSDDLRDEIQRLKQTGFKHDAYMFHRLTNYCGKWIKHCGWYPDKKIRLWNKNYGEWSADGVHEKLILRPGTKVMKIKKDILHYSFYTISQHMATINEYSSRAASTRYQKGKKFSFFKMLGSPIWKFFSSFVLRGGFLDGYYGYVICRNSAHSSFLKQVKLRELWEKE